jgi:protein-L-isoaspartate(D-aspartate) O-methyltransferase
MTKKAKQFPLPLSSVVDNLSGTRRASAKFSDQVATPQTATRNAQQTGSFGGNRKASAEPAGKLNPLPLVAQDRSASGSSQLVSIRVRRSMVDRLEKQGIKDALVLSAMEAIPRHLFVEQALSSQAYIDASLPIGHQQTISRPYIVARMIEAMRNSASGEPMGRVLEIGTGCGYQAAVLSRVAKDVYSIERIKALHELAKSRLRPLCIPNLRLHYGDGMLGLSQAAPFDGIILAAAGMEVPNELLLQLTIGGRLIAPVGNEQQSLQLIERVDKLKWKTSSLEDCHFVPLCPGTL